jgi:MATE family multidrug resistance protein
MLLRPGRAWEALLEYIDVVDMVVLFLGVAALFQLADCLQVLANGVLRGLGDTRLPLAFTFLGYIVLALPLGWWGAFRYSDDPIWLWYGLTLGLSVVAFLGILRFRWQIRRLRAGSSGRV